MSTTTLYVLDRSLCARCGNEGTLKHEGKLEGCPDCPTGREVNLQLAEIKAVAEPYGYCIVHGEDWDEGGRCDTCAAERSDEGTFPAPADGPWAAVSQS